MLKIKAKYIITLIAVFIAICLLNVSTVQATNFFSDDGKFLTKNEIEEGLVYDVESWEQLNTARYYLTVDAVKSLNLLSNTNKLDSLIQNDNYIYQNVYVKLDNDITHATMQYGNTNVEKQANIVSIDNVRYAEIPLAVFAKIDNVYHPADLIGDGIGVITPNSQASIKLLANTEEKESFVCELTRPEWTEDESKQIYGAIIELKSDINEEYELAGAGWLWTGGIEYDRILAKGDCYINVEIGKSVGETLQLEPFGTLQYKGTTELDSGKMYQYQAKITNKKLFNQERILCRIALPEYKIVTTTALYFRGDLIVDDTETKIQEIIDLIPNTITLDIPEVEYEKAGEIVKTNVKKILDTKGIKYENTDNGIKLKDITSDGYNIEIDIWATASLYTNEFYDAGIYIKAIKNNIINSNYIKSKKIKLVYNNTDKYNLEDEKYVKNLVLQNPHYLVIDFEDLDFSPEEYDNMVVDYYTKMISDQTITFKLESSAGGGGPFPIANDTLYGEGGPYLSTFKNGILYDVRRIGCVPYVCQITIPDTVGDTEEDYIKYATPIISNYWKELCLDPVFADDRFIDEYKGNITLSKGATIGYWNVNNSMTTETYDVENGYTVKSESGNKLGVVILKKDDTTKEIQKTDKKTNIKFEAISTVVPEDIKLVVEEIKEEKNLNTIKETIKDISNKYVVFNISLVHNNEEIQPNGKVKISIPVPNGYDISNLVVFRIEADGSKVEFKVEVVEIEGAKYAQFETDHFSNYVLAEKTTKKVVEQDNSNKVLDDQPKTGIFDMKLLIGIAMVVFTIVVVKNKRKNI